MVFPNWPGFPDHCKCRCGQVRYSRSNPENLWQSFNPRLLWEIRFLFPVFGTLRNFIWTLPRFAWTVFRIVFCSKAFKEIVIADPLGKAGGRAMIPVRFLPWSAISLFLFLLVVAAWLTSRFTLFVLVPPYVVAMAFVLALILLLSVHATTRMAWYALVFLIGGAASFGFGVSPVIGILMIVLGVCLEYESRRRRDLQNREQIGRLLRIIEQTPDSNLPVGK